jgi:hypothetical protein
MTLFTSLSWCQHHSPFCCNCFTGKADWFNSTGLEGMLEVWASMNKSTVFVFGFNISMPVWHQLCFWLYSQGTKDFTSWITAYVDGELVSEHVHLGMLNMSLGNNVVDQIWTNMETFR